MKGPIRIISSLALATSYIISSGAADAATLENTGFESYTTGNGIADSWVGYQPSTATGSFQVVTAPVQEGLQAQQFRFSDMNLLQTSRLEQLFDIEPGAEYEISGYFHIDSLVRSKVQLSIEYFDAAGNLVDSNITNQSLLTNGFVRLQTIKVANLQAVKCRISVNLLATSDGASGAFTVDQFALRKTNGTLINPGFEDYHGMYDVADTWRLGFSPKSAMAQKIVTAPVASGQYAQKISAAGLPYWGYAHVVQVVTAREGLTYTVGGKFNIAELNASKVQLYVDYYDANYKHLGSDFTDRTAITNGYLQLQNKTTAPKNAAFLQVWALLRSTGDNGSGTFYVDDVSVASSADLPKEQPLVGLTPVTSSSGDPEVFGYDFQTPTVVREYEMQPVLKSAAVNTPKTWTFEGYDGERWVVLDTRAGVTDWSGEAPKKFPIANLRPYWEYRLNVTDNNGDPTALDVQEVSMNGYYAAPITPQDVRNSAKGDGSVTLTWSPANGVASYKIYQDDQWVQTVPGDSTTATVKGLTNNKVYHYTVSAVNSSGESLKSQAIRAMPYRKARVLKPRLSTDWSATSATAAINFDFQKPVQVQEYTVEVGGDATALPQKWTFEGFDGTDWIVLDEQSGLANRPANTRQYFALDNVQRYLKYRLNASVSISDLPYLKLHDVQLIGE